MRFDIISIFPESFASYFQASLLKRAEVAKLIDIHLHNLRDFTHDKHKTTDDTPYGGGAGMVMKVEPFAECLESLKKDSPDQKTRTLLLSAKGKFFTQADAKRLEEYERIILLCGRYEGVDERVRENLVDEELSIGEYVLTGGELPAMIIVDAVTRLIPGVLGNSESSKDESFSNGRTLEYPQYTKPEEYRGWKVPPVLLSGNHKDIEKWHQENSKPSDPGGVIHSHVA